MRSRKIAERIGVVLAAVMLFAAAAGCGKADSGSKAQENASQAAAAEEEKEDKGDTGMLTGLHHVGPDRSARTRGGRGRDQQNLARLDLIRVGQSVDALNNRRIEVIIASDLIADLVQRIAGLDGIGNKIERNAPSGGSTGGIAGGGQGGPADRRRGHSRRGG